MTWALRLAILLILSAAAGGLTLAAAMHSKAVAEIGAPCCLPMYFLVTHAIGWHRPTRKGSHDH